MSVAEHRRSEGRGEILVAADAADAYTPDWFGVPAASGAHGLRGGRGNVRIVDSKLGPLVHRGYRRGGLPRHFIRDRYLWLGADRTRSFEEFRLLQRLHAQGLAVPMPVAARYQRAGLSYRADLLTRLIPHSRPLVEALADPAADVGAWLEKVAVSVAALHAQRVWHADLNAHNILVDAAGRIWLLDFDRARENVASRQRLAGNLDRLLRSLRKLLPAPALESVQQAWPHFLDTYRQALAAA